MAETVPPWLQPDLLPEKPADPPYGYFYRGIMTGCPQETLIVRCGQEGGPNFALAWSPEAERLVPVEEMPFLHDGLRQRSRRAINGNLKMAAVMTALYTLPMLTGLGSGYSRGTQYRLLPLLVFGLIPLVQGLWTLRDLRRLDGPRLIAEGISTRYAEWRSRQSRWMTTGLLVLIGLVFLAQCIAGLGPSIQAAGLTKSWAGWSGSYRFLTAALLHGGILHIVLNALTLFIVGVLLEAMAGSLTVALIFLLSALGGTITSFLINAQTSVGASGGIMGIIGALCVFGFRFRKILPPKFALQMVQAILITAAIGLFGRDIIDNAAHAGGLLAGLVCGVLLCRHQQNLPLALSGTVRLAGAFAALLLLCTAIAACTIILRSN